MNIINLTTGLEFLPDIIPDGHCRLQSSHLESKAWQKFLDSVDSNILYALAQGEHVTVYDCGSRQDNGCSRVIWQGLPFVKYVLERAWLLQVHPAILSFRREQNVTRLFETIYTSLDKQNVRYYRKHVITDCISLDGVYKKSLLDGKETSIASKRVLITK